MSTVHCLCGKQMTMTELATVHGPKCKHFMSSWEQPSHEEPSDSTGNSESRNERDAMILELYDEGLTLQEIGDKVDLTRERVRQIVRDAGRKSRMQLTDERAIAAAVDIRNVLDQGILPKVDFIVKGHKSSRIAVEKVAPGLLKEVKAKRRKLAERRRLKRIEGEGVQKCHACNVTKLMTEFSYTSNQKRKRDRSRKCKTCASETTREWYKKNAGRTPEPTVDEWTCSKCGVTKPASEYARSTSAATGLQSNCKECHKLYAKARQEKQ